MSRIDVLNWDRIDALEARIIILEAEMRAARATIAELLERISFEMPTPQDEESSGE